MQRGDSQPHPLDPLDPTEIETASQIALRAEGLGELPRIVWATLDEPDKAELAKWRNGNVVTRAAVVSVVDRVSAQLTRIRVDLTNARVTSVDVSVGEHAAILAEEWQDARRVLDDPRVVDALAQRGVVDLSTVEVEPWPAGYEGSDLDRSGRRLARCVFFIRAEDGDTDWARPIDQLVVIADRGTADVLSIEEGEVLSPPADPGRLDPESQSLRTGLLPLHIEQPDGPSFELDGHELRWQGWTMRIGTHPIDGLVIHTVTYDDPISGRTRSILHRASMAEMVVPYGDPSVTNRWRHVFDAGEVGLGKNCCSLSLGCDCLGEIRYLDAHMAEPDGTARTIPNAICIHEEDDGVLWRHEDAKAGLTHVRRSRRLQVSCWANLGNYDYGFYWNFHLDGSIHPEVKLTGVPLAMAEPTSSTSHLERLVPGLVGPIHQHLFCFRLDLAVDGERNSVEEIDVLADSAADPTLAASVSSFSPHCRTLRTETEACRNVAVERGRRWRFSNPDVLNSVGQPVAYELHPTSPSQPVLAHHDSWAGRRMSFARHHLWVTPFAAEELHPAGEHPNQSPGDDGLATWTAANRSIERADLVAWYTCGVTHIARPEDWPVMPVDRVGFHLKPAGFFDRNPSMDVPPQELIPGQNPGCTAK